MPVETAALTEAVKQLTRVVERLDSTLTEDYPKRRELERDYISKEQGRKRLRVLLGFAAISLFCSYLVTIGTVSGCFLGDPNHPPVCKLIPGYDQSIKDNKNIFRQFTRLQKVTEENAKRLDRLEKRH